MTGEQYDELDDDDVPPRKPWSANTQAVAAVLWSSFLAASLATMLFFAFIDPAMIHGALTPPVAKITRMTGYGVGFFFFWLVCATAGGIAVYLVRTAHPADDDRDSR